MPFGYSISVAVMAIVTAAAVFSQPNRSARVKSWSYTLGFMINELPMAGLVWLAVWTGVAAAQGDLGNLVGLASLVLALATAAGLLVILVRALPATTAVESALGAGTRIRRRSLVATLLQPVPLRPRRVERIADISYGPAGTRNLLDVYVRRRRPAAAPVLVYFHGGSYRSGHKHREGRPLLHHLADRGWVCISANYRLSPAAVFPDHLIDAKRVLAWVRSRAAEYGGDPNTVVLAGSSAGGHLAAMTALTANQPALQPGFEHVDTTVTALVSIYAYFGRIHTETGATTSPLELDANGAPPTFVLHGDLDSLVPVTEARRFVGHLRASGASVSYAELPGAVHGFDVVRSVRSLALVDGIEAWATRVLGGRQETPASLDQNG